MSESGRELFDEDVNNVYKVQMGASRTSGLKAPSTTSAMNRTGMNRTGMSAAQQREMQKNASPQKTQKKNTMTAKPIASMQEIAKPS